MERPLNARNRVEYLDDSLVVIEPAESAEQTAYGDFGCFVIVLLVGVLLGVFHSIVFAVCYAIFVVLPVVILSIRDFFRDYRRVNHETKEPHRITFWKDGFESGGYRFSYVLDEPLYLDTVSEWEGSVGIHCKTICDASGAKIVEDDSYPLYEIECVDMAEAQWLADEITRFLDKPKPVVNQFPV